MITDDSILVDPMVTNSLGAADAANPAGGRILQPYTDEAPVEDYTLLTVIDGVAFVQIRTFKGKNIVPLSIGARLPGAGPVERISRSDGRWTLKAGDVTLAAERQ